MNAHLVPSWDQKGTQFQISKSPSNESFYKRKIKKVPSLDKKGINLALSWHQVGTKFGLSW